MLEILKERIRFELAWNWNHQRHKVIVLGIMLGAIITGSILLGSGNIAHNIAEAGRHRN